MRVYLAGGISGVPDYAVKFALAAKSLREDGHLVFNPAAANQEGRPLREIMAYLLPQLCEAEGIVMLRGWWRSGGARIEWMLAKYLKLKVLYL